MGEHGGKLEKFKGKAKKFQHVLTPAQLTEESGGGTENQRGHPPALLLDVAAL